MLLLKVPAAARLACAGLLLLVPAPGSALTLAFSCISDNLAGDCAIGEAQITVDVTDPGGNQVLFTVQNAGPEDSSATDVYFDDGALLGIASLDDSDPGVAFSSPATPAELPAANDASPPFVTTAGFSADSDPPAQPNGVNPGETLGILFNLAGGSVFADVLADLATGDLRVGLHVQGYASGGSESLVNVAPVLPPAGIPEPGAAMLFLVGLAVAARTGRLRSR